MLKSTTIRLASRRIVSSNLRPSPRFVSTGTPKKSRSWKSSAARWGVAIGAIYWYNTSPLFAEEPEILIAKLDESIQHVQESSLPTLDAIVEEKRLRKLAAEEQAAKEAYLAAHSAEKTPEVSLEEQTAKEAYLAARKAEPAEAREGNVNAEESEEAGQQAAFNPETGEINWDCPCLGGMADGPCGEEFKAAFSCFVYSTEEPKGMECIEKFKGMQDCFRTHPEVYGAELEDDEDEVEEELRAREELKAREASESKDLGEEIKKAESEPKSQETTPAKTSPETTSTPSPPPATKAEVPQPETPTPPKDSATSTQKEIEASTSEHLVPKAAFDATDKN